MRTHRSTKFTNSKKSFFFRIFLIYILVLVSSLGIVFLIWNNNIKDTTYKLSGYNIKDVCKILNLNFSDNISTFHSCLDTIAANEITYNFLKNPNDKNAHELRDFLDLNCSWISNDIKGIGVMTDERMVYGGYAFFPSLYKECPWYQELMMSDGSNLLFNRVDSTISTVLPKICIGKALVLNSKTVGIVVMELDSSFISNLFGTSTMNGVLRTVVIDGNKNVVFANNRESKGEYLPEIIEESKYLIYNNILHEIKLNQTKYIVLSQNLSLTPDWINITYLPKDYLYQDYQLSLTLALTWVSIILVFSVLLTFIIFLFWAKKLSLLCSYIEHIDLNDPSSVELLQFPIKGDELDNIYLKVYQMACIMLSQLNTISSLAEKKHSYEIQILKAQINPHLIYNTLNVIQTLAKLQKNERIANISGALSELLHYSVANTDQLVPLSCELQHAQSYLDIMQNKFLNDISLFLTIEDEVSNCKLLKMTLQPFIENSIRHGFSDIPGNYILIKAYLCEGDVLIRITDNGKGISAEKLESLLKESPRNDELNGESHLGLKNVDRRLKLTFGEKYGLKILSVPNAQTTVLITIPYIQEGNI